MIPSPEQVLREEHEFKTADEELGVQYRSVRCKTDQKVSLKDHNGSLFD